MIDAVAIVSHGPNLIPRVNVLGVGINAMAAEEARAEIRRWILSGERRYVNVCTVHTIMECQRSVRLREIVNRSGLATADGMPLVWLGRLNGLASARVYGPDLMLRLCEEGVSSGCRHFFYGGAPGVAETLAERLRTRFPGLRVVGVHAPPSRHADVDETAEVLKSIDDAKPDIVWVGLGCPKQDYWVARHRARLSAAALIGVGAAFDFHAGLVRQAPRWMQQAGLEWLFRFWQEPRRLAFRYLVYNPLFVVLATLQFLRIKHYPRPDQSSL